MDRNKNGLLLPDQNDLCLRSGHSRIKQVPPQHDVVLFQEGDNDDGVFLSLTFMDGGTVGKFQISLSIPNSDPVSQYER